MTKKLSSILAALFAVAAHANEGKLIASVGDVSVVRNGQAIKLERGATVLPGDLIKVGSESSAQVRMSDQSIMALGQKTEFKINEYRFTADKPTEATAGFALIKGAFRTITGLVGKHAPDQYSVKAGAVATIGIRGTHYRLRLCENDCAVEGAAAPNNGLYGGVSEGRIGVTNEAGTDEFGADEYFFVANAGAHPERLPGPPDLLIDRAAFLAKLKPAGTGSGGTSAPQVSTDTAAPSAPMVGAASTLSSLTLQQLRPSDLSITPDRLAHVAPIVTPSVSSGSFANIGGSGEIRGQAVWLTNADIDLHMQTPAGAVLNYGNLSLAVGGATARLDHDNRGSVIDVAPDKRVENITINGSGIPVGTYQFYVNSFNGNNGGLPTTVQIQVTGNANATSSTGSATLSSGQTSSNFNVNYQGSNVAPTYSTTPR